MTPAEWNLAMALPESYATVAHEVRSYLVQRDDQISTTDLVNALYPPQFAVDDDAMKARKRLFGAVQKMAGGELSDCATKGPEKKVMGRSGRAWLWHASRGTSEQLREAVGAMLRALNELMLDENNEPQKFDGMDEEAYVAFIAAWDALELI